MRKLWDLLRNKIGTKNLICGILGICLPLARGMGRCAGKQHQEVLRTMQSTEK